MKYRKLVVLSVLFVSLTASGGSEKVNLGIDNIDEYLKIFEGKRVGLITNQTGVNSEFVSSIDILKEKTDLKELYCPEHGIRGDVGPGNDVATYKDTKSSLTVYSLYKDGTGIPPDEEMLKEIDILAYDIQDVGARFYTYISTMMQAMKSCREFDKEFVVFDRPNPISGNIVEGGIMQKEFISFVGIAQIPVRYGLTCGELARYLNDEMNIGCNLKIIPMSGWNREMFWEETGLHWIPTSPNIPTAETAIIYSGTCFFEGTNLSVGRGTALPFVQIGAPWLSDPETLCAEMEKLKLAGVKFRPLYFTPLADKYKGELCGGAGIYITDKAKFRAVETSVNLLFKIKELYSDNFEFRATDSKGRYWIDLLTGSSILRESESPSDVLAVWDAQSEEFKKQTAKYYIYK